MEILIATSLEGIQQAIKTRKTERYLISTYCKYLKQLFFHFCTACLLQVFISVLTVLNVTNKALYLQIILI